MSVPDGCGCNEEEGEEQSEEDEVDVLLLLLLLGAVALLLLLLLLVLLASPTMASCCWRLVAAPAAKAIATKRTDRRKLIGLGASTAMLATDARDAGDAGDARPPATTTREPPTSRCGGKSGAGRCGVGLGCRGFQRFSAGDSGDASDSSPPRPAASRHTQTGRDVADSRHPAHGQAKMLEDARQDARPASHNREKVGTGQQVDEDGGK